MAIDDFSIPPYFDDFNEVKKYLKILFSPRLPVQTRELNQLQTVLQNQIGRHANHIFQDGAMVLPGHISYDLNYSFVKVVSTVNLDLESYRIENFLGKNVENSAGVKATIVNHLGTDVDGNVTFFVKYIKNDTAGTVSTFANSQVLTVEGTAITATIASSGAIGVGCSANIDNGIYYAKGYFHIVDKQTIILDAYTNTPSYRVGLTFTDSIVTSEDDQSLTDNAQGTPNFSAPGADRYKAELILSKLGLDTVGSASSADFYELLKIEAGQLNRIVQTTEYSELEKTFARRTWDESGDYTTKPFYIKVADHASDSTKLTVNIDSGKAYVRGYEILKVGKTQIDLNKARTYDRVNNASIATPFGNYVRVNNVSGVPDIKNYTKVTLYDKRMATDQVAPAGGNVIGTARVRDIKLESGTYGTDGAVYRLYLFDISISSTTRNFSHTKSYVDTSNKFTCDSVVDIFFPLELGRDQSVTLTNASATVVGKNTLWQTDPLVDLKLVVNDCIVANGVIYTVATISSNTGITVSPTPSLTTGDYAFAYTYTALYESNSNTLVFPLPFSYPRKIKSSDDTTVDTNYKVRREHTGLTVSGGAVTISTGTVDEEFAPFSQQNYIVTYDTAITQPNGVGAIVNVSSGNFSSLPNSSVTINGLTNGETVRVISTLTKKQGTPSTQKMKTLVTTSVSSTANERNLNEVSIGKADIYAVTKVYMKDGDFATAPTSSDVDITDRYILDNGQRDNFYGLGKIVLRDGAKIPNGRLLIEFSYFQHTGNGTYFSVDSYVGAVTYENIPRYESKELGWTYELRDCLDFRPRINDAGSAFDNTTGSLTEFPVEGFVQADFSYYLNRIDKLYLDYRGNFHIIEGVPALNPTPPSDPTEDGMVTHQLNVRSYTNTVDAVVVDYKDNKRFTMRDIGKLEKRIENLEYYTKLSLLEKETKDLEIIDATTGLNRFKNGFIVEPFSGHGIGDVQNDDYQCSIDMQRGLLRPIFAEDNVKLILDGSSTNYVQTGDLITLPYTHSLFVSQKLASNAVNVNPFNVINFLGKIDLVPPHDEWKDTVQAPDLIVNHEGNFDSISQMVNGMGTIWNEWQTNWAGITASNTDVLSQLTFQSPQPQVHRNLDGSVDTQSALSGVKSRPGIDEWPVRQVTVTRTTNTVEERQSRNGRVASVVPKTINENLGDKVINIAYLPFIRSRDVVFRGYGLKPNTRVYPFFDKVAVSTYCSPGATYVTPNGALITDATGKVTGTFRIPANDTVKFRTGERLFRLSSSSTDDSVWVTSANATYRAQGLLETKQTSILSTRNAEVAWDQVNDNRIVTDTTVDVNVTDTNWIDPLAQTFLVNKDGGAFITKLDLYFRTKDANIPVTVQIRETVNGYPGSKIVPFAEVVLDASSVHTNNVVNGELIVDGGAPDASFGPSDFVATTFTFPSPVYLKQGVEYCFVILANTDAYELWIATFGNDPLTQLPYAIVGSEIPVQAQPYGGSFFKSQNASTWTAVQEADIMFQLHCASFNTGVIAEIVLTNDALPTKTLITNPLQTSVGYVNLRVSHPNHGMPTGSKVTLSGVTDSLGILASRINTTHDITDVDLDSYVVTPATVTLTSISSSGTALTGGTNFTTTLIAGSGVRKASGETRKIISVTNNSTAVLDSGFTVALSSESVTVVAGSSGTTGGASVVATENKQVDVLYPLVGRMDFPNTTSSYYYRSTSGKSVNGTQTPYVLPASYVSCSVNDNLEFSAPQLIASPVNEANVMVNGASKSFFLKGLLQTTNANLSPVIDTQRLSLITVANRVDSPTYTSKNINPLDYETILSANTTIAFTATTNTIQTLNATHARNLSTIQKGRYVTIAGASNGANNGTFRVTNVVYSVGVSCTLTVDSALVTEASGASVTVTYLNRFVSEKAPLHGSVASKYVSRRMVLENPANALRIQLACNLPSSTEIELYYKVSKVDDSTVFDELDYVLATPDTAPGYSPNKDTFTDVVYTINGLADFNSASFKIVLKSTSSTDVPVITDFSAIALGT